ncbi:peptidyl-tRNA hydrolase ICT1, mitochondrial [Chrysoperla carnea]|uniref:peptidyl-tRNA hydrolase ICT1, mitochondrial n=1 Tax=Chrysoperla carnea TaxID=189513 RepID=UPI001D05E14A|nr:peptidyl-tRNA hydrolase ICT1, mitochondrial [Chrysoperla carnea]
MSQIIKKCLFSTSIITRNLSYQSSISLKNLYPNSSLKITTPTQPNYTTSSKFSGIIPMDKIDITYSRSSGPGGQNVNTVSTKVDLRFHVATAEWLDPDIRQKLVEQNKTKINKDGYLIIKSELTRSQQLNVADALEKLRTLIRATDTKNPELSPETQAKIQKRIMKTNRERLLMKRQKSQIKSDRQAPDVYSL